MYFALFTPTLRLRLSGVACLLLTYQICAERECFLDLAPGTVSSCSHRECHRECQRGVPPRIATRTAPLSDSATGVGVSSQGHGHGIRACEVLKGYTKEGKALNMVKREISSSFSPFFTKLFISPSVSSPKPLIKLFFETFWTLAMHLSKYSPIGIPIRDSTISLLIDVLSFRKNQQSNTSRLVISVRSRSAHNL